MGDGNRRIDKAEAVEHSEMLGFKKVKKVRVKGEEAIFVLSLKLPKEKKE